MHTMSNFMGGLLFLGIGIAIRLYVGRRQFYRRNEAGIEEFSSYSKAVVATTFESLLGLVGGTLTVLGGLFALVYGIKLFF